MDSSVYVVEKREDKWIIKEIRNGLSENWILGPYLTKKRANEVADSLNCTRNLTAFKN